MDKNILSSHIDARLSIRGIADATGKSPTTIRYWLGKYGLKTDVIKNVELVEKLCNRCEQIKPITEFYTRRDKDGSTPYCRPCSSDQVLERQRKLKHDAVMYKGGSCVTCGYDKCDGALQFHHLDPTKKEFTIGRFKLLSFDKIKTELDKCILLCANCHHEVHYKDLR